MTRKIISALLALILCCSLAVSASAETAGFVVDEVGYLADMERELLNKQAQAIYEETGVGIFFVYTTGEDILNFDVAALTGGMEDHVVMVENREFWCIFPGGSAVEYISADTEAALRDVYDDAATYVEGVSGFMMAAAECFPREEVPAGVEAAVSNAGFLYDEADLLTQAEEAALEEKLAAISGTYNAQIVVYTVPSVAGGMVERYIDVLYDTMDFGYGVNRDGVLLLVCMNPRQFWNIGNGFAGIAIGNDEIDAIGDAIIEDMSQGNYAAAFDEFADQCDYYLDGYFNGFPFAFGKNLLISLAIGLAAGLIVAFVLKAQLKTVHKQDRANAYVRKDSMNLTRQSDIYLYRTVSRTKKSSSSGSSGSGGSRSKGGRSF